MLKISIDAISVCRRFALYVFTVFCLPLANSYSYTEQMLKDDWSSPFQYERSRDILKWGAGVTLILAANRDNFVDPLAEDIAKDEPLGEFSKYGDLAGQTIPNLLYIGSMYARNTEGSLRRARLMFKATALSGVSVFFLKRLINQKRPDGGDRNSHPSGHTTTAFAFASVVSLEHPNWSLPAYSLATFVGLSRMNDNVHYLHDIVMGAAIGSAFGYGLHEKQQSSDHVYWDMIPVRDGGYLAINYYFD